jgi:hypothetical protein
MLRGALAAGTAIENAGSELVAAPLLTQITICVNTPTLAAVGVPDSCPVSVLKLVHDGRLTMADVNWYQRQQKRLA